MICAYHYKPEPADSVIEPSVVLPLAPPRWQTLAIDTLMVSVILIQLALGVYELIHSDMALNSTAARLGTTHLLAAAFISMYAATAQRQLADKYRAGTETIIRRSIHVAQSRTGSVIFLRTRAARDVQPLVAMMQDILVTEHGTPLEHAEEGGNGARFHNGSMIAFIEDAEFDDE